MQTFLAVADTRSFSEAARRQGLSPALVSRRIGLLEEHLGIRLFNRSTRRVELSEAGARYAPQCLELLNRIEQIEADVAGMGHVPQGNLRIAVPMDFGRLFLQPAIREFLSLHPRVRLEVVLDDRRSDLLREQIDLAIRIGQLPDSSLVARRLGQACIGCYASPDYLAQHGEPDTPEALPTHQVLEYTLTETTGRWHFEREGQAFEVAVSWQLAANNARLLSRAACRGLGIVRAPEFLVQDHLEAGRLMEILRDYRSPPLDISLIYLHRQFRPAALTALAGFLVDHFRANTGWQPRTL